MMLHRRVSVALPGLMMLGLASELNAQASEPSPQDRPPNVVVIFADDMGYGDLSCYGHPSIRTPHLDRMAQQGQKWTSFYVAAAVCTPSRAALLTGRLPLRSGTNRLFRPNSTDGLPQSEITIARMLKQRNYATACIGKWHLGHHEQFLPTSHGFDYYFGIPYSNDMGRKKDAGGDKDADREMVVNPRIEYFNVPLMRNTDIVEQPADQATLTQRYTQEVIGFMRQHRAEPFFVYYAQAFPHVPLFRSPQFVDRSDAGIYGDVIEELDWSVGQVLAAIEELDLADNTLVVFTSDNGPWLIYHEQGGSAGALRDGKSTSWEGGMRVPAIMWWPGRIKPQVVGRIGSTLDLLPTIAAICGATVPADRPIDGYDLTPTLMDTGPHPRDHMFYYLGKQLAAVRLGPYKAHYVARESWEGQPQRLAAPLLFHLGRDPGEKWNIADRHPEVLAQIDALAQKHAADMPAQESPSN